MSQDDVRFGVIGYGLFGTHHASAISKTDGAGLAAIAVKSEESRRAAMEAHPGCEVLDDWRALIDRADIDVVDVVVPNAMHHEVTMAALGAGKHVLLEKPMAIEVAHCEELVALAASTGKVLAVGHELRLSPLWGGVKRLIDEGRIGEPLHALVELSRFPYRRGAEGWRYDIERVGNWILEEPIHFFDLARWYLSSCGEPQSVFARANSRHRDHPELRDNFSALVDFPGGAYAVISQTLSAYGHHLCGKVVGTDGMIWARWGAADARSQAPTFELGYGLGDDVTEVSFEQSTGELLELADEIAAMVRCVRDGAAPPCTAVDGRWSTILCLAAEESVLAREPVSIDGFVERSSR